MQGYLPGYELDPTTWVYVSSLLTIGVFFKFHRFWSVRNLDLAGLILLAPGLLWVARGQGPGGYIWLFTVGSFFLVRLLLDPLMVRRPLLEPNLNASGLTFTGIALMVFLMSNVVTGRLYPLAKQPIAGGGEVQDSAYPLLYSVADLSRNAAPADDGGIQPKQVRPSARARTAMVRTLAILAHLAMVIGIALIGYRHFDNVHTGVAMASLYLVLPYTAQMAARVDHVVPAVLLVWAIAAYRRPALAGIAIGLAAGLIGYPLFLVPLWTGFYWRRGLIRFAVGVVAGLVLLVFLLLIFMLVLRLFGLTDVGSFGDWLAQLFGWTRLPRAKPDGFWQGRDAFRIPVIAAFCVLSGSLALWPAQKNLGTLLSCSAAVMLGVQFWHPYHGGVYMAWYLPLLVLTIFRPNLEDRVAVTAVSESRAPGQAAGGLPWRIDAWTARRKEGRGSFNK